MLPYYLIRPIVLISLCFAIVSVLASLFIVLLRERVKEDLRERCFRPLSIQWRPFGPGWGYTYRTGFRVFYIDFHGRRHKAFCRVGGLRFVPNVRWTQDNIVDAGGFEEPG